MKKKQLTAVCRACGTTFELDTAHKAGKQLHKDIPTYYQANPEFQPAAISTPSVGVAAQDSSDAGPHKPGKKGKKRRAGAAAAEGEGANQEEEEKKQAMDRAQNLMATGGEVNILDSVALELTDDAVGKYIIGSTQRRDFVLYDDTSILSLPLTPSDDTNSSALQF